jgi:hypothetical protein
MTFDTGQWLAPTVFRGVAKITIFLAPWDTFMGLLKLTGGFLINSLGGF